MNLVDPILLLALSISIGIVVYLGCVIALLRYLKEVNREERAKERYDPDRTRSTRTRRTSGRA